MGTYTKKHDYRADAIVTPIAVCEAITFAEGQNLPKIFYSQKAIWDTGATNTLISPKVVEFLNLSPYNKVLVSDNKGVTKAETYLVHVVLPTKDMVSNIEAILTDNEDYDVLIGMDIINLGEFLFSNKNGKSEFTFTV